MGASEDRIQQGLILADERRWQLIAVGGGTLPDTLFPFSEGKMRPLTAGGTQALQTA